MATHASSVETSVPLEPGSFRDPESRVLYGDGVVYRALSERGRDAWEALVSSGLFERLLASGRIVGSELLPDGQWPEPLSDLPSGRVAGVLRHERIPFVSYPYEWPFEMLRDAARLQLDVLLEALDAGLTLKDSTPYNVQWRAARPVFVDVGSFEPLREGRPWLGYRQFCMLFLYPLMLRAHKDLPFQPLLRGAIDGITPTECNRIFSRRDRLRAGVFKHVYLHSKLERRYASAGGEVKTQLREAGFGTELVRANVRAVSKVVERLEWKPRQTAWTSYSSVNEYSSQDVERKRSFVSEAARSRHWPLVWDLGCNDGAYTRIATAHADYTVAIDADEALINGFYSELREEGAASILPLTMNLADPSPSLGWRGKERMSLPDRGKPHLTLCLALIHHLSISANVPIRDLVDWLHGLGSSLVIEFVTPEDPMVELLLSRKEPDAHPDYRRDVFESALEGAFNVERSEAICEGRRILYFAHPKPHG